MAATPPNKVAFVGLGTMGFPMAGHLQTAGYATTVFNRTTEKAANWCAKFGGQYGSDPADAATDADVVMVCVGNDDDVRSVVLGDAGVLGAMKAGSTLIDHTTCSAELARELGGQRVLLVTDPGIVAAGHARRVHRALQSAGMRVTTRA